MKFEHTGVVLLSVRVAFVFRELFLNTIRKLSIPPDVIPRLYYQLAQQDLRCTQIKAVLNVPFFNYGEPGEGSGCGIRHILLL